MKSWLMMFFSHKICTRPIGRLVSQFYSSLGCFYPSGTTGRVVSSNTETANNDQMCIVLAVTKQLYEWFSPSVCLSVHPPVTPFSLCSHRCIIMKFSWFMTNDRSDVHAKDQDQRSKVKVTEIKTQFSCFRTVTPVWIYIWWWNNAHRYCLEEVPYCFSRSSIKFQGHTRQKKLPILTIIECFRTVTPVWIHQWIWNDAQSLT